MAAAEETCYYAAPKIDEPTAVNPLKNPQVLVNRILWSIVLVSALWAGTSLLIFEQEPLRNLWIAGAVIGGCVMIPALICQLVILPRVQRHLDALWGGNYLVHWKYRTDEWQRWVEFSHREWGEKVRNDAQAYIAADCVYVGGRYDSWKLSFNFWLESASLEGDRVGNSPRWIEITFGWTSGQRRTFKTVRVPLPEALKENPEAIVRKIHG